MLIEVKAKTARLVEGKIRKKTETYLINKEFFSQAEYAITEANQDLISSTTEDFYIISMKASPIKEIIVRYSGVNTYVATLKDVWLEPDGTEKYMRYKVLLWANSLTEANRNIQETAREGYDMTIEGIKEVDYQFLEDEDNE